MNININAYKNVEELKRFNRISLNKYCAEKLKSTNKHIKFIKKNVINNSYQGNILEVGSGNAKLLIKLEKMKLVKEGVGVEISNSRCKFAKHFIKQQKCKKIKIINNDFFKCKFKKNSFDLIIGTDVVINLIGGDNTNNIQRLFNRSDELLRPGGKLVLEFMTFEREIALINKNYQKVYRNWKRFHKSDPFKFGLDEYLFDNSNKIIWNKFFIPRLENKIESSSLKMLPLNKNFFIKNGFRIFNRWNKNDDTLDQEFIAMKKF